MREKWSESEAFGELRSIVNGRPGAEAFARVCALVDEAERAAPGLYAERWRDYLDAGLERWPSSARAMTFPTRDQAQQGALAPWSGLLRGVSFSHFFDLDEPEHTRWLSEEIRAALPRLEHLELSHLHVRKSVVERACEAGVFEGLSSLSFERTIFKAPTFAALLRHLEGSDVLRRLTLNTCQIGARHVEMLCQSELASRLEVLNLRENNGVKAAALDHLAEAAPAFTSLRELVLLATRPSPAAVARLARAEWPEALERLDLRYIKLGVEGLEGFVTSERLGLLFDRSGGEVELDLRWQGLGDPGVEVLAGSAELAEVEALLLYGNGASDYGALAVSEHLGELRALNVSASPSAEVDTSGQILEIVRRADLRRLVVSGSAFDDAFVASLCGMDEAMGLESLEVDGCGARGLDALLGWPRLKELHALTCDIELPDDHASIPLAVGTGVFEIAPWSSTEDGLTTLQSVKEVL